MMESEFLENCRDDNLDGVNDCLSHGVDVNTVDSDGRDTGLMVACYWGHSAIVSRLVQVPGLDINWQNRMGSSAVHKACSQERVEISHWSRYI